MCAFKTACLEERGENPKFLAASSTKPTPRGALVKSLCAPQPLPCAGQALQPLLPGTRQGSSLLPQHKGAARFWLWRRRGGKPSSRLAACETDVNFAFTSVPVHAA